MKRLFGATMLCGALATVGFAAVAAPAGAVWSGVNGKLLFFKDTFPASVQVYSMNQNGNGLKNLSEKGGGGAQLDIQPSASPDGQNIAFARLDQETGSPQIWTMTFEGLKQTNISNDASSYSESGPAWSADGSKILFVRQAPGSFPGDQGGGPASAGGSIWMRNADGSGVPVQITAGPNDANPTAAADGVRLAFSRPKSGARHIFVMNLNGSGLTDLGQGAKPDWSPDNTHIVYGQGGIGPIMVVNVSNPADTQTLFDFGEAPVWSPDGTQIAFMHCTPPNFVCQIAVMNANGTGVQDLTNDPSASSQKVDWQAHAHH